MTIYFDRILQQYANKFIRVERVHAKKQLINIDFLNRY